MITNIISDFLEVLGKYYFKTADFLVGSKGIADNCRKHLGYKVSVYYKFSHLLEDLLVLDVTYEA